MSEQLREQLRPAVFVGSSAEGHDVAESVQVLLDRACEVEIWSQGVFGLGDGTLEALVRALSRFDFAVLIVTPDDTAVSREVQKNVPRDNIVFELGLFMGALGRERTFMVYDRTRPPDLPTDLAGVICATYEPNEAGIVDAALGAACTMIKRAIRRLGLREIRRVESLAAATESVRSTGAQMEALVKLLARSRKVELDIIASQFGGMISREKLSEMQRDLRELEATLRPDKL